MPTPPTSRRGRVFSVPPGTPFLKELAAALVDGRLVDGFRPADDPFLLPQATVYLPNRRAARAFGGEIIEALGGAAALLPDIRTLGDSDEDELALAFSPGEAADLPPATGTLERQLQLAAMVRGWATALSQATRELFGDEDIIIPSSAADALALAGDLARLLDQIETEEVAWDAVAGLAGTEHAQWWELTVAFLKIVTERWPQHLREAGKLDPSIRRRCLLDLRTRRLTERPGGGPVIAAGSTGSIPAAARFIAAVARCENGAVVLPGIDFDLPQPVWQRLARSDDGESEPLLSTHPQQGLARLLARMQVDRGAVEPLGTPARVARRRLISLALLPADETERWHDLAPAAGVAEPGSDAPCAHVAIIEAPGRREEALAIAIALREALEQPGRTAALTTPDRTLARRVTAELRRFAIAVDDSAGTPLTQTPAGRFLRLLVAAGTGARDPVGLTALMKDPALSEAIAGGDGRPARLFELAVLRDAPVVPAAGELEAAARRARDQARRNRYAPATVVAMQPGDWASVAALARHVDRALAPLARLAAAGGTVALGAAIAALRQSFALALADPDGGRLAAMRGGRELIGLFDAFDGLDPRATGANMPVAVRELADVAHALARDVVVRDIRFAHPRLHIWGPLEARLQHVDRMILGGLNEGTWPAPARNDAFLNRPMRAELDLSLPERRIGQSAHDFSQLAMAPEVILTRSIKVDNAPAIASRWLQRLAVVAGGDATAAMRGRGQRYLDLAEAIDNNGKVGARARRPCPRPPVALRPARLSITEIETWIRDPYAVYARHVLGLAPLPALGREADPALRGAVYHEVFARFVSQMPPAESEAAARQRLADIAGEVFHAHQVPDDAAASWLPRLIEIGRLFIDWEHTRRDGITGRHCEIAGEIAVGEGGFRLRGRADRIDVMTDGTIAVFDYKTGTSPTAKQARIFSPQLSLEARMAELGAFGPHLARPAGELAYVRLRPGEELRVDQVATDEPGESAAELARQTWSRLDGLVAAYGDRRQGYLSRYAVMREGDVKGDYDHLARVREWSVGDGDDDDG